MGSLIVVEKFYAQIVYKDNKINLIRHFMYL